MTTTFTPGPWFAHEPVNPNRRDFGVTAVRPYDPSVGAVRRIAWVGNQSNVNAQLESEIRANAQLIAAAPDLFEALKLYVASDHGIADYSMTDEARDARKAAIAALTKAGAA